MNALIDLTPSLALGAAYVVAVLVVVLAAGQWAPRATSATRRAWATWKRDRLIDRAAIIGVREWLYGREICARGAQRSVTDPAALIENLAARVRTGDATEHPEAFLRDVRRCALALGWPQPPVFDFGPATIRVADADGEWTELGHTVDLTFTPHPTERQR